MPEYNGYQPNGSLLNMMRHISSISLETAQEIEAYFSTSAKEEPESDLLYQLPSMAYDLDFAAQHIPATVMFIDLRDFTSLVETCPPNQVVRQLNEYFSAMTRVIVEHGGVLDKYMGDEIMAYFECRNESECIDAAHRAVSAGIQMLDALERLNARWKQRGWPQLKNGIGINSGIVLKGNLGSMVKLETTIIGDTVNVASRLQKLNKDYNASLLISASTFRLVHGQFPVRSLGELAIRGRKQSLGVYEVDVPACCHQDAEDPPHTIWLKAASSS